MTETTRLGEGDAAPSAPDASVQREAAGEEGEVDEVEVEVEQEEAEADEPGAPSMSDDEVEEVAPPLPRLVAVASSFAGGDVQISAASGTSKPICP